MMPPGVEALPDCSQGVETDQSLNGRVPAALKVHFSLLSGPSLGGQLTARHVLNV